MTPTDDAEVVPNDSGQPNAVLPPSHFHKARETWALVGLGLFVFTLVFGAWILRGVYNRVQRNLIAPYCPSNLKQIGLGLKQYAQDNDGLCPPGTTIESWKVALFPFLGTDKLFVCPIAEEDDVSYALNTKLAGANLDKLHNSGFIPVAFETRARHSGYRYVVFVDGHVKSFKDSTWKSEILPRIRTFVPNKSPNKE